MFQSIRSMIRRVAVILITAVALGGCAQPNPAALDRQKLAEELGAALYDAATTQGDVIDRHALLLIDTQGAGLNYVGVSGIARADAAEPMAPDRQFMIASVAKSMTSVVIYQLAEAGAFGAKGVDATLAELEVFPPEVLAELLKIDGVSYGAEITLHQLLTHTSGLRDLFFDGVDTPVSLMPGTPEGAAPGSLIAMVAFDPERGINPLVDCTMKGIPAGCKPDDYLFGHHWTAWDYAAWQADPDDRMAGLLNYYLSGMNEHGLWRPGEGFHYGDTNYILLGLVIEKVTGHSLHHELRARVFDPLKMDSTYLVGAEDPPASDYDREMADVWAWGQSAISGGVDFSFDWGGGGIVSTLGDLQAFTRALAAGDLFQKPATLERMLAVPQGIRGIDYASGLIVFPTRQGPLLYMFGSNGTWVEYYAPLDLVMVGTVDDFSNLPGQFMLHIEAYRVLAQNGLPTPMATAASLPMLLVTASLGLLLILMIVWLAAALVGRRSGQRPGTVVRQARWLAVGAFLSNLALMVLTAMSVGDNPFQVLFGFSPQVRLLFVATAVVMGLFALVMVILAVGWRRRGEGRPFERGVLVAVAAVMLAYAVSTALLG